MTQPATASKPVLPDGCWRDVSGEEKRRTYVLKSGATVNIHNPVAVGYYPMADGRECMHSIVNAEGHHTVLTSMDFELLSIEPLDPGVQLHTRNPWGKA